MDGAPILWIAPAERSDDAHRLRPTFGHRSQSGVALRLPPQSTIEGGKSQTVVRPTDS